MNTLKQDQETIERMLKIKKLYSPPAIRDLFIEKEDEYMRSGGVFQEYTERKGDIIVVNWERLIEDYNGFCASEGVGCEFWDETLEFLENRGVLHHRDPKGFHVVTRGLDLCPMGSSSVSYHFTRELDALEFKRIKYKNTQYPTRVVNLGRLI